MVRAARMHTMPDLYCMQIEEEEAALALEEVEEVEHNDKRSEKEELRCVLAVIRHGGVCRHARMRLHARPRMQPDALPVLPAVACVRS